MKKTPIDTLHDQVNYFKGFKSRLISREEIDKDAAQDKINGLISDCDKKITEFEEAIKVLESKLNKWDKIAKEAVKATNETLKQK